MFLILASRKKRTRALAALPIRLSQFAKGFEHFVGVVGDLDLGPDFWTTPSALMRKVIRLMPRKVRPMNDLLPHTP